MIKKISVRKDQLALLSRNGDYYKVLHAGEHLLPWLNTPEVLLITLDGSEVPDVLADYLRRFQPDWVEKYCLVADLSEIEPGRCIWTVFCRRSCRHQRAVCTGV